MTEADGYIAEPLATLVFRKTQDTATDCRIWILQSVAPSDPSEASVPSVRDASDATVVLWGNNTNDQHGGSIFRRCCHFHHTAYQEICLVSDL